MKDINEFTLKSGIFFTGIVITLIISLILLTGYLYPWEIGLSILIGIVGFVGSVYSHHRMLKKAHKEFLENYISNQQFFEAQLTYKEAIMREVKKLYDQLDEEDLTKEEEKFLENKIYELLKHIDD